MTAITTKLVEETATLKATLASSALIQSSGTAAAQRRTTEFVATMNQVLRAKAHTLGIYHGAASKSRPGVGGVAKPMHSLSSTNNRKATCSAANSGCI